MINDTLVLKFDMGEDEVEIFIDKSTIPNVPNLKRIARIKRDDDSWTAVEKVLTALGVKILTRAKYDGEKEFT